MVDEDIEEEEEELVVKPKKRPAKAEETRSKKEHINVVFIGHVGKFLIGSLLISIKILNLVWSKNI